MYILQSRVCMVAYSRQSMFSGDLIKPPATIAGVDILH